MPTKSPIHLSSLNPVERFFCAALSGDATEGSEKLMRQYREVGDEAARQLRDEPGIFFLLIGEGEKHAEAVTFVERHQLNDVRVFPFQPEDRLPFTLPLGDIALVTLDEGMEDLMVPSKAFFYLAAGSALIAIANEPSELSDLLEQGEIGVRLKPRQPVALAEAIRALAADRERLVAMRAEARRVAEERYSREAGVAAFAHILDEAGLGSAAERG